MASYQEPVPVTCPDIDHAVSMAEDITRILEKLRESNDALRSWGNELVEECKEHEKEQERLRELNDDLEYKLDEANIELQQLRDELASH